MSRVIQVRIRLFVILVVLSTLVGVIDNTFTPLRGDLNRPTIMFIGGTYWFIGSSLVWGFEILFVESKYGAAIRRLHFLAALGVKSCILIFMVAIAVLVGRLLFGGPLDIQIFIDPWFFRLLASVFVLFIILQTISQVVRIIGGRTLFNFLLGKYHRPVREEKIFMFLELEVATALAVKLGDIGVQTMITKFFFDITEPIIENGGEIHRYIGDEVIVTWPLKAESSNAQPIECSFAIADLMAEKAAEYERKFGIVPSYRIGLHGGPVVISECGDQKQEISYFGDTINTSARIEQQCKKLDCGLLISGELLAHITLPRQFSSEHIGDYHLRGRENATELYTINRA